MAKDGSVQFILPTRSIRLVSIAQIVLGCLCLVWQTVNIAIGDIMGFVGTGYWCGLTFIIAGAFGLKSPNTSQPCGLGAWLAFSLFAIPLALTLFSFSTIGVVLEATAPNQYIPTDVPTTPYPMRGEKMGMDATLAVSAIAALVVCIAASVISCRGLCRLKEVPYQNMDSELPRVDKGSL